MLSETFSMRTITGMRCTSRIHSKVDLTELGKATADAADVALQGSVGISHQHDNGSIAANFSLRNQPLAVDLPHVCRTLPQAF